MLNRYAGSIDRLCIYKKRDIKLYETGLVGAGKRSHRQIDYEMRREEKTDFFKPETVPKKVSRWNTREIRDDGRPSLGPLNDAFHLPQYGCPPPGAANRAVM